MIEVTEVTKTKEATKTAEAKFFVYGSMSQGLVHFNKIKEFILDSQNAFINGTAYRLQVGYPVLTEDGSDLVAGEIVTLKMPDLLLSLLDEFHGFKQLSLTESLYFRKQTKVTLEDNIPNSPSKKQETAWVYFLNPSKLPKGAQKIESGDWKACLASQPLLTKQLTERQKNYISKLGSCSGREIVPIDLDLYLELIKLEIVVDKGRRLALSKLGHEIYRYLD